MSGRLLRSSRHRSRPTLLARRGGMATIEVVMCTAVTAAIVAPLLVLGLRACKNLYQIIGSLVGWPFV